MAESETGASVSSVCENGEPLKATHVVKSGGTVDNEMDQSVVNLSNGTQHAAPEAEEKPVKSAEREAANGVQDTAIENIGTENGTKQAELLKTEVVEAAQQVSVKNRNPLERSNSDRSNEDGLTIDEESQEDASHPADEMKPISVDVSSYNALSGRSSAQKTGPKSAPAETIASSRPKRPRMPVRHFEFEELEDNTEIVVEVPPQKAVAKVKPKKSPASNQTTPREALFDKGDYCTVRSDLQGENFYLCLLLQNVYENTKALVGIRWLEIEKSPNQYKWSYTDKIDKGCILTNVAVESLGKDRIILPNSEIMRSIYVLKKSIQSEKGEKVSLELPPRNSSEATNEETSKMRAEKQKPVSSSHKQTPTPIKRTREASASSTESEQLSDVSEEYVAPKSKSRGSGRGQGKRGRPTRGQGSNLLSARPNGRPPQLEIDSEYRPSVDRKTRARLTPTKTQLSPVSSGRDPDKTLSPVKSPIRSSRENYASRIKVDPNDLFFDTKYVFEDTDARFKAKQLIRVVSFGDHDLLKRLLADPKLDSVCCSRSKDCSGGAFETAASDDDVTSLVLLMEKSNELKSKNICLPNLLDDDLLVEDWQSRTRSFPYESFFESLMQMHIVPSGVIDLLVSKGFVARLRKTAVIALRHGNFKTALHVIKVADSQENDLNFVAVLEEFDESKVEMALNTVTSPSLSNCSVMHAAACNTDSRYLSKILEKRRTLVNVPDANGWYPFHYAAACKESSNLELLCNEMGSRKNYYVTYDRGFTPLMVASANNRVKNVQLLLALCSLIEQQQMIEMADLDGKTSLHLAAEKGHLEVLNILLPVCLHADVSTGHLNSNMTPLMLAASQGHFKCCETLIARKCDVNLTDSKGRSALTHAVINGYQNIVSLLICNGANPNVSDENGNSLVHYAVCYGWAHCLTLLIDVGMPLSLPLNKLSLNPLFCAVLKGNFSLATKLLHAREVDINARCAALNRTILHHVIARDGPLSATKDMVAFLLKLQSKPNCKIADCNGNSALHLLAVKTNLSGQEHVTSVEIAKMMLEAGADCNISTSVDPPFALALQSNNFPLAKYLLNNTRAFFSGVENEAGMNALHFLFQNACQFKVDELVGKVPTSLTSNSEFANSRSNNAITPLSVLLNCLKVNFADEVKLAAGLKTLTQFLSSFSKCNILMDFKGAAALRQAVDIASLVQDSTGFALVSILLNHRADPNLQLNGMDTLLYAVDLNCGLKVVELLASKVSTVDSDINLSNDSNISRDDHGCTPLMFACKNERLDLVQLFLSKSVSLNKTCGNLKKSLLHVTVESVKTVNGILCLEKILSKIQNPNLLDSLGNSALHYAVQLNLALSVDVCKMLLKAGCSASTQNSEGKTPLHVLFCCSPTKNFSNSVASFDPLELLLLFLENSSASFVPVDNKGCTVMHYIAGKGASLCAQVIKDLEIQHPPDKNGNTVLCHALINRKEDCAIGILNSDLKLDLTKLYAYVPPGPLDNPAESGPENRSDDLRKISAFSMIAYLNMWRLFFLAVKRFALTATNSFFLSQIIRSGSLSAASLFLNNMHPDSLILSDHNQNHFHDISLAYFPLSCKKETFTLAKQLYEKSVKILSPDKPNSVLCFHYAAYTANTDLLEVLCESVDCEKVAFAKDDLSRTVLAAALMSGDVKTIKFCLYKLSHEKYNDIIVRFGPVRNPNVSVYEGYNSTTECFAVTPLIYSINHIDDPNALETLVSTGSFDLNKPDENKVTAIMYAVSSGNSEKVKTLLNAKDGSIDLSTLDSDGNTVAHYVSKGANDLGKENADIVDLLHKSGVTFSTKNTAGKTAFELAVENAHFLLVDRMRRLEFFELPKGIDFPSLFEDTPAEAVIETPDFKSLSSALWEKFKNQFTRFEYVAEVDKNSLLTVGSKSEVVVEDGVPMDASLIRVETGEPPNLKSVSFSFYKMQLVHARSKNGYYLHVNSGSVGQREPSQVQSQLIQSLEQAKKEFSRLFKTKTDNIWEAHRDKKFVLKPKKYTVLKSDYSRKVIKQVPPVGLIDRAENFVSSLKTKYPEVFEFLERAISQTTLRLNSLEKFDASFMECEFIIGSTSDELIQRLQSELCSLQSCLEDLDVELSLKSPNWNKILTTSHKMNTLSNEIYYSLPMNFDPCHSHPFFTKKGAKLLALIIETVRSFHVYSQIWLAALNRLDSDNLHPVDFVALSMPVSLKSVSKSDVVYSMVSNSITAACSSSYTLHSIFKVSSSSKPRNSIPVTSFEELSNHLLLWYPIEPQNILSLLAEGVKLHAAQEPFRHNMPCAQFTDSTHEAMKNALKLGDSYCLALCHVNLGRSFRQPAELFNYDFVVPANADSLHCESEAESGFVYSERTLSGGIRFRECNATAGKKQLNNLKRTNSSYAVFDSERIKLCYLIRVGKN